MTGGKPAQGKQYTFPVETKILPEADRDNWPKGYLQTIGAELYELYGTVSAAVTASGISKATIERASARMSKGWDWRSERKKLERKYWRMKRAQKPIERTKGRPSKDAVFVATGEGDEELKKKEADAALVFEDDEVPYSEEQVAGGNKAELDEEAEGEEGGNGKKPSGKKKAPTASRGEVPVSGMSTRRPVVTFRVNNEEIGINPDDLFDMYFIYRNIVAITGAEDSFMEMLRYAIELLWQLSQPMEMPKMELPDNAQVIIGTS